MAEQVLKGSFPSQVASDVTKASQEYGLEVAKAIESEWFGRDGSMNRFNVNQAEFHRLRLYARGEQGIQKYKDELSINGDLSFLNLDWKPVPIIPKFVDIVVNGIADRAYDVKAYSQDPYGVSKRTEYMESIMRDMLTQDLNTFAEQTFGVNLWESDPEKLPEDEDELAVHMQLTYKQAIEIAEEQAISVLLAGNRYNEIKKRVYHDLTVIGIGAVKNSFSKAQGVTVDYVDPANKVWSFTDSPYFDDIYYCGEVKTIPINELKKQFPDLMEEDLVDIQKQGMHESYRHRSNVYDKTYLDKNSVQVLYFNYKTYMNEVYKIKGTPMGGSKVLIKDDSFDPPLEVHDERFGKLSRSIEVLYEGALVVGTKKLLKWEMAKNMMRSKSDHTKVKMNYAMCAPRMYKGRIESLVSRITGFADMIQLTHLKLQQVLSRVVPDGVYLDADGLAEVDLGNGTNYNPQEALNMFFQTGSVIGRSFTGDGEGNPGKIPIQEIQSGAGGQKIQSLIQAYNYYLQMIRDVTGLNEARDASTPSEYSLVGVQKLAAANSNVATRHILNGGLLITSELCECLSLRIADILEYSPTKDAFIQQVGAHNVATLDDISNLHLHDFGIFIDLEPDEEEKQMLEQNIQMAIQKNSIDLEDAIDIRQIKNVKLANQLIKIRRKTKVNREQEMNQQNIQSQADANTQTQQAAAQTEIQKQQQINESKIALEEAKSQFEQTEMQKEAMLKKELMNHEFKLNMQLKEKELESIRAQDQYRENRKDDRTKIQASQQSELIEQRKTGGSPKKFESSGNDTMGQGIDISGF